MMASPEKVGWALCTAAAILAAAAWPVANDITFLRDSLWSRSPGGYEGVAGDDGLIGVLRADPS